MEAYWKTVAAVLLAVILGLALAKQEKDIGLILSMAVCVMTAAVALHYLEPVICFLRQLEAVGNLPDQTVGILMKALGIGLLTQLAGQLCADGGNHSLEKGLQLLGSAVILHLCIPVFSGLLELIQQILGEL